MNKKILGLIALTILVCILASPLYSSTYSPQVVTYGETTYNNPTYKDTVNNYFSSHANIDLNNVAQKVITQDESNAIAKIVSNKEYNKDQILSCALIDLSTNTGDIQVDVDSSKITLVTPEMYKSALQSNGINNGHIYVTSPTTATGETALTGVFSAYEIATGVQIPQEVKESASKQIYVISTIATETHTDPNKINNIYITIFNQITQQNITDQTVIVDMLVNLANQQNIHITHDQAVQIVQQMLREKQLSPQIGDTQNQLSSVIDNGTTSDNSTNVTNDQSSSSSSNSTASEINTNPTEPTTNNPDNPEPTDPESTDLEPNSNSVPGSNSGSSNSE